MSDEQERNSTAPALSLDSAPGLLRVAAGAWVQTGRWTASSALRAGRRVARAARSGESVSDLVEDTRTELREAARRVLGVSELEEQLGGAAPSWLRNPETERSRAAPEALLERGADLLTRSSELEQDRVHPAFSAILDQLTPDEARILRLLLTDGPQALVYVHRSGPFGLGAREVARRLSMIGHHAGCLHLERVPEYLDNLARLGLIRISPDPVEDESAYQVLAAQPDVIEAMREGGRSVLRSRGSRRSVELTEFGRHFCELCLPLSTDELDTLDSQ